MSRDFTPIQRGIMEYLVKAGPQRTVTQIAKGVHSDRSNVTKNFELLEERRVVQRFEVKKGRVWWLSTDRGMVYAFWLGLSPGMIEKWLKELGLYDSPSLVMEAVKFFIDFARKLNAPDRFVAACAATFNLMLKGKVSRPPDMDPRDARVYEAVMLDHPTLRDYWRPEFKQLSEHFGHLAE